MPIIASEIQYRLSGGAANADPMLSLGGIMSGTAQPLALFDTIVGAESAAGDVEYRCIYVRNGSATLALQTAALFIQANTVSADTQIAVGLGTAAVNAAEQIVANESTAPVGVTFNEPATLGAGLALGTIPAGQFKSVWLRRTVNVAAAASNDTYNLRTTGDTAA